MPDAQLTLPLPAARPARRPNPRVTPFGEACLAYMRALVAPTKKPRRRARGE